MNQVVATHAVFHVHDGVATPSRGNANNVLDKTGVARMKNDSMIWSNRKASSNVTMQLVHLTINYIFNQSHCKMPKQSVALSFSCL